jgi:hypothetical protein
MDILERLDARSKVQTWALVRWPYFSILGLMFCTMIASINRNYVAAQVGTEMGRIQLSVVDENRLVVAHAAVTVLNSKTGSQMTYETDDTGKCLSAPISFGEYFVTVKARGFETLEKGVSIGSSSTTAINLIAIVGNDNVTLSMTDDLPSAALTEALVQEIMDSPRLAAIVGTVQLSRPIQRQSSIQTRNKQAIVGTVLDDSGIPVLNARVTLTNTKTEIKAVADSGSHGSFAFSLLEPGEYKIDVVAKGFGQMPEEAIRFEAGQVAILDLKLTADPRRSNR